MGQVKLKKEGPGWGPPRRRLPPVAGIGRGRKIAMIGGGVKSMPFVPWHDPAWELWAHATSRHLCVRPPECYFDLHPPELFRDPSKKFWDTTYLHWLRQNTVPIYMQDHYPDIPMSMAFPYLQILHQFRAYFSNHLAWMIALAITEGVTHIGIYGCDYANGSEYENQRGSAEYWCGFAEGYGVTLMIAPECDLLNHPRELYGYESHPKGVRVKSYSCIPRGVPNGEHHSLAPKKKGQEATALTVLADDAPVLPRVRELVGPDGTPMAPAWERSGFPQAAIDASVPKAMQAIRPHDAPPFRFVGATSKREAS